MPSPSQIAQESSLRQSSPRDVPAIAPTSVSVLLIVHASVPALPEISPLRAAGRAAYMECFSQKWQYIWAKKKETVAVPLNADMLFHKPPNSKNRLARLAGCGDHDRVSRRDAASSRPGGSREGADVGSRGA